MKYNDDLDILGFNDPLKAKISSAQMSSARDVAEWSKYQEQQKAALAARNKAIADAQREKERIEAVRHQANETAQKERDRIEELRHQETRRFSLIAIWIAVASLAVAIFK